MIKSARKLCWLPLLAIVLMLFPSGCSVSFKSPAELVEKPKLSVRNNLAKEAIQRELPKNTRLIRPLKPGTIRSVGYFDLDGDGQREAYAFYQSELNRMIGLLILREKDEAWEVISRTEIPGEDIAYADFVDFNSDGSMDLLFSSNTKEGVYGIINAYLWEDGEYKNIWFGEFNELVVDDMNGNKNKEILCVKHERGLYSGISVYAYMDKSFQLIDELEMDLYINGYYNVFSGDLSEGQRAVFLDYNVGGKSASNVVLFRDEKLSSLLPLFSGERSKPGIKNGNVNSRDVDKDGIIEIAANYSLPYSSGDELDKKGMYSWNRYDESAETRFRTVALSFIDKKSYFEFVFPKRWMDAAERGRISFVTSSEGHKRNFVSFFYLTENLDSYMLLTFEHFNQEDYDKFLKSESKKYFSIKNIFRRGNSRIVAYYNKNLEPEEEADREAFRLLQIGNEEMNSLVNYIK
ncbi:MAG: VCBS repeat-containing protein [Bacillota bacterium]|nr:VCBS repeat-containing protein [Bacillota bacterium]